MELIIMISDELVKKVITLSKICSSIQKGLEQPDFAVNMAKEDVDWINKNKFLIFLELSFIKQIKEDILINKAREISNLPMQDSKLGLKYLAVFSTKKILSKLAYCVYNNPYSGLSQYLVVKKIFHEVPKRNSELFIMVPVEEFMNIISEYMLFLKFLIISKNKSKEGVSKNEDSDS